MKIEIYPVSELTPYEDNPRHIDEYKFEATKQSILDFPDMMGVRYVIINKDKQILCGNMRYRACMELGMKTIPAMMVDLSDEKAKELIMYNEMSIADIAYTLNYSSAAHFSTQFKKVTGLTPSFFKKLKKQRETDLEDL